LHINKQLFTPPFTTTNERKNVNN